MAWLPITKHSLRPCLLPGISSCASSLRCLVHHTGDHWDVHDQCLGCCVGQLRWGEVKTQFNSIWEMTFRQSSDDIKESVRGAALGLAKSLRSLSLRIMDVQQSSPSEAGSCCGSRPPFPAAERWSHESVHMLRVCLALEASEAVCSRPLILYHSILTAPSLRCCCGVCLSCLIDKASSHLIVAQEGPPQQIESENRQCLLILLQHKVLAAVFLLDDS